MRLSAKSLKNVENLNTFQYTNQWIVRQDGLSGEEQSLYFQLVDLDKDGVRYIPNPGTVVIVTFPELDETMQAVKTATNPFADDRSVFKIDLTVLDIISSGNVKFQVTESTKVKKFSVMNMVTVELLNAGGC